jgi:alpha-L-rhamnosidase
VSDTVVDRAPSVAPGHLSTHRLPSEWSAQWISPAESSAVDRPAYMLTQTFELDGQATEATLFSTALGVYEAFVNDVRVGQEELMPGATNYAETLYAQSFDVTAQLRTGDNKIEILLSDGWYRGRNGSTQVRDAWGTSTAVLAQLEVTLTSGTVVVGTDASWTGRPSRITRADLMAGQSTDFTAAPEPAVPVLTGTVQPPTPSLSPAPPVRRVEELQPVRVAEIAPGVSVVDFGQNIAGWTRLSDLGPAGAVTKLEFGEHVGPDGDLVTTHLDTHTPGGEHIAFHQSDSVVSGGAGEVFEPRHTVHGFRYARVTHTGRRLDPSSLTAVVVHTDLIRTGWFTCSDGRLDRLHETAVWTFRSNAVDVPTDCPTRERLGWTGDFQVFAPFAALLYDIDGFARKWLQAVRDDQYENGSLAMYSPDSYRMKLHPENPDRAGGGSAGWGDAVVAVPWALYRQYGDRSVLADNWDAMRAWVEFALETARKKRHPSRASRRPVPAPHERFLWDGSFHFGEWAEPRPIATGEIEVAEAFRALMSADKGEVGTAFLYRSTSQLSRIASVLGRPTDAAHYQEIAGRVREAWVAEYLSGDGRTDADTQASYVRAIDFGLVPDELVPSAAARLVELIETAGWHLGTGFLATGSLLEVLAATGYTDVAYRLLTQTGVPSWTEMLNRGATTFWENWEGVDATGAAASGSLNHYSKGAAMRFLYTHVVGLRQEEGSTGWRRFVVAPSPGGDLTRAEARLQTPAGRIGAAWWLEEGELALTITVPGGASATAILPGCEPVEVGPGVTTLHGGRITPESPTTKDK